VAILKVILKFRLLFCTKCRLTPLSRDPKGQTRDPVIFEAPYLHNGAR